MPLGIKRVRKPNSQKKEMDSKKAALRLIQFEKKLLSDKVNKKRKRENGKAVCDEVSINDPKNGDTLDLEFNAIDSENKLTDTTATIKADLQDTDANTVPLKKRKRDHSTCDIASTKSEIIENKKLRIENSKKSKGTKIKLNQKGQKQVKNNSTTNKNIKHKTKKTVIRDVQTSDNIDQYTSISPISSEKILLKEINNKSIAKKTKSKNKYQETPLKNVNGNSMLYFAV